MNFGSKKASGSKEKSVNSSKIVSWVKICIQSYGDDDSSIEVMVTELECSDPDCVPLETLVALLGKDARWTTKILKPLIEVTIQDVEEQSYPESWSEWVQEYSFTKEHTEVITWMSDCIDDFDDKISELCVSDQLTATLIMERAIKRLRLKMSPLEEEQEEPIISDDNINTADSHADSGIGSGSEANNEIVIPAVVSIYPPSTFVSMRKKTDVEQNTDIDPSLSTSSSVKGGEDHSGGRVVRTFQPPSISTVAVAVETMAESVESESIVTDSNINNNSNNNNNCSSNSNNNNNNSNSTINLPTPPTMPPTPIIRPSPLLISSTSMTSMNTTGGISKRHKKGSRPRGCPCCDPDSIDNIVNKMIFLETPP